MQNNSQNTAHAGPSRPSQVSNSSPSRMRYASFAIVNASRRMTEEEMQKRKVTNPAARFIFCLAPHLATSSLGDFTAVHWGNYILARFVAVKSSKETRYVEVFYVADDPSVRPVSFLHA